MKDSDLTTSIDFLNTNDPVIKTTDLLFYSTREIIEHAITIRVKSDKDFKYVHKGPISSGKEFWNLMLLILGNL